MTLPLADIAAVLPELIVVGVTNTNRSRDLTPPSADDEETAFWDEVGGADRFRRFFREELIPFIDGHYRTPFLPPFEHDGQKGGRNGER